MRRGLLSRAWGVQPQRRKLLRGLFPFVAQENKQMVLRKGNILKKILVFFTTDAGVAE